MPHEINWYDPKKILLWKLEGYVDNAEMSECVQELLPVFDQAVEAIQLIIDFRQSTHTPVFMPTSIPDFPALVNHKNMDWAAVLGITPSVGFILKIISKHSQFQYAIFDNVEEAVDFLRQVRILQRPGGQADALNGVISEAK